MAESAMKVRFSAPAQRERLVTARSSPLPNKQENDHHSTDVAPAALPGWESHCP